MFHYALNHRYSNTLVYDFLFDLAPGMVSGISTALPEPNSINVAWEPENSQCIRKRYVVEYQLTNLDQCNDQTDDTFVQAGQVTTPEIRLQGLEPFSTYTIRVTALLNDNNYGSRLSATFKTGQTGKIYIF